MNYYQSHLITLRTEPVALYSYARVTIYLLYSYARVAIELIYQSHCKYKGKYKVKVKDKLKGELGVGVTLQWLLT